MSKLEHAVEVSLRATAAARDAVAEILKRGAATGIFFAQGRGTPASTGFELMDLDRDFLRSLSTILTRPGALAGSSRDERGIIRVVTRRESLDRGASGLSTGLMLSTLIRSHSSWSAQASLGGADLSRRWYVRRAAGTGHRT